MTTPTPAIDSDYEDVTTQHLVRVAGWAVLLIGCSIAALLALDTPVQHSRVLFNLGAGLVGGLALLLARMRHWRLAAHLLVWGCGCSCRWSQPATAGWMAPIY